MYLICGNGGLAAEASHFVGELVGKYHKEVYLPAIDLGANEVVLTAAANDFGWENAYAHLVRVYGKPGDTFIGLTTSHSPNIVNAAEAAFEIGMDVYLWDADSLDGDDVAQKQENALWRLHELAKTIKDDFSDLKENVLREFGDL